MIELEDCSVWFDRHALLSSINLTIRKHDFFCIVGESGGGKTLLSQLILGVLPPTLTSRGRVLVNREHMEFVLQDPIGSLQPNIRIGRQFHQLLRSKGEFDKAERQRRVNQVLSWVGFSAVEMLLQKRPFELSGGMCQKVAIAMALVSDPTVLVADEPTSALDERNTDTILKLLWQTYQQKSMTVLLITHDLEIVKRYSSAMAVMKDGLLVEQGLTKETLAHPQHEYTKELVKIFDDVTRATSDKPSYKEVREDNSVLGT